ncbi:SMP-30/gluconolactonase/LRE family protein [Thalassococcus sp. S3]|uniref:SMP-30/gluconolactonase/LRE family protein n=1 Tax=Thalassococcus sp. S3 TaxID=2017482 RepID=UPI001024634C|nr:SMP-30/gluconolactonase/LRE family protein [Thalassococcus sp. S3]QBF30838.1 gluconolactonase [Thalassococcus sp. S3]
MTAGVFDDRVCKLGEGPLWHPVREQLFWFDILGKRLLTRAGETTQEWHFDETVSAAGWLDTDRLLIASETALWDFSLTSGDRTCIVPLEAENPVTRSNDGRADPWGGFWIGTMGKHAEAGAGAIYRYFGGELRCLHDCISVANAICFSPGRDFAYFTDTHDRRVLRHRLDPRTGWPKGDPDTFLDLRREGLNPDGAVIDAKGWMWIAQWGASRIAVYDTEGTFRTAYPFAAEQTSCPAFGGPDLTTLYCTSASVGLSRSLLQNQPSNGMTFHLAGAGQGQAEHQVIL